MLAAQFLGIVGSKGPSWSSLGPRSECFGMLGFQLPVHTSTAFLKRYRLRGDSSTVTIHGLGRNSRPRSRPRCRTWVLSSGSAFPPPPPPPSSAEEVRTLVTSSDYVLRLRGAARIRVLPAGERLPMLMGLISDTNSQVRYTSVSQLSAFERASLSGEDRARVLERMRKLMFEDSESSVRAAAADVIMGLGMQDGFDDLVRMYEETKDWMVRFSIVAGMGELGGEKAFSFLHGLISGEGEIEPLILTGALGALGDLGDPRGLELVEPYLECSDKSVKERARISYNMLKEKTSPQ